MKAPPYTIAELKQSPIGLYVATERGREALEIHAEFLRRAYEFEFDEHGTVHRNLPGGRAARTLRNLTA